MVWKALEALGMLSEALGSFDVNTVCPLPGSWINHVTGFAESRPWECRVFSFKIARAHHKSLVLFRSLLLPAVANLVFCLFCLHLLYICM